MRACNSKNREGKGDEYQLTVVGTDVIIDATIYVNRGRHFNDSCSPNSTYFTWKLLISNVEVVLVQAVKAIKKDEEFLVAYGWRKEPGESLVVC